MSNKGKFKKNGMVIAHDEKHTGPEPLWDDANKLDAIELQNRMLDALRFYEYYLDRGDMLNFAMEWMVNNDYGKEDIKLIRNLPKEIALSTAGKLCRMLSMGMPEVHGSKDHADYVKREIAKALEASRIHSAHKKLESKIEEKPKTKPVPPMKRLENKVYENVIAVIDWALDDWIETKTIEPINVSSLLGSSNIPAKGCQFVITWLDAYIDELKSAQTGEDEEAVEGYSFLTKRELNKWLKSFEKMKDDVEKYKKAHTKAVVRVKKVKPALQQVSKLNYDKENSKVSAMKIPGSVVTIIFNAKNRKLQVYHAVGRSGLSVKGTSIKDFDETKSYQVTVRQNLIDSVIGKDPKAIEKVISPKTKRTTVNGRVNENCTIVYVK